MSAHDFDPRNRELCADGACIGLIGPDGRCKVCRLVSRTATQHPRYRGMRDTSGDDEEREAVASDAEDGHDGHDDERDHDSWDGDEDEDSWDEDDEDEDEDDEGDDDADWGQADDLDSGERELCPDGACVGLIGPDGRCKECGTASRTASLDPRNRGLRRESDVAEQLEADIIKGALDPPPDDLGERQLCSDGACIGVIGPDGRCKECGARAAGTPG